MSRAFRESFVSIYVNFSIKYDVARESGAKKETKDFRRMSIKLRGRHFGMPLRLMAICCLRDTGLMIAMTEKESERDQSVFDSFFLWT